jgi:hypothetical protein
MPPSEIAGDHVRMDGLSAQLRRAAEAIRGLAADSATAAARLLDDQVWSDSRGRAAARDLRTTAAAMSGLAEQLEHLGADVGATARRYAAAAEGMPGSGTSVLDRSRPGPREDRDTARAEPAVPYVHAWNPAHFQGAGDPVGLAGFHRRQAGEDTCAVVAQLSILESLTGAAPDEQQAASMARSLGVYTPGEGTALRDLGAMLEHHGVPVDGPRSSSVEELAQALNAGRRVLVAMNAKQIWTPLRDGAGNVVRQIPPDGHAVWVTGIDNQEGQWTVIVSDPGQTEGAMVAVALEDFIAAWADFDRVALVAGGR